MHLLFLCMTKRTIPTYTPEFKLEAAQLAVDKRSQHEKQLQR